MKTLTVIRNRNARVASPLPMMSRAKSVKYSIVNRVTRIIYLSKSFRKNCRPFRRQELIIPTSVSDVKKNLFFFLRPLPRHAHGSTETASSYIGLHRILPEPFLVKAFGNHTQDFWISQGNFLRSPNLLWSNMISVADSAANRFGTKLGRPRTGQRPRIIPAGPSYYYQLHTIKYTDPGGPAPIGPKKPARGRAGFVKPHALIGQPIIPRIKPIDRLG